MGKVYVQNRSKQKMIIAGVLAIAVIVVLVFVFVLMSKSKKNVLEDYYSLISEKDYQGMYDLLSDDSQEKYTKEAFIERNQKIYEGIEATDITIENVEEEDDSLNYVVKMKTVAGNVEFKNTTYFDGHDIIWSDGMIYPTLQPTYKVRIKEEKATRGKILDRHGEMLAGQGEAYRVGLVKGKLNGEQDFDKLATLLSMSRESIQKSMSASWVKDDSFVPLKTIDKNETQLKNSLLKIAGVKLSTTSIRTYPYGKVTSHMLGYLQKVTAEDLEKHKNEGYDENSYIGRSGIEAAYEKQLKGEDGLGVYIVDEQGQTIDTVGVKEKKDGQDIQLTIDLSLQKDLYNAFAKDKSASVAINPTNGEVLALVSTPSFSSQDFILGMSSEKWNSLNSDQAKPLYNRFKATWVPGSSMKPITGAIGLDSQTLKVNEDLKAQSKWQKDSSWGSYYVTTLHAPQPNHLKNALIYSDNVYFAKAALKIGATKLSDGYKKLKIGEKIPFELALNQSQYTSGDFKEDIQVADSGYGQGEILMNPVQLASIYGSFVYDGKIMTPHLVLSTQASAWIDTAFSKQTCQIIKEDLAGVINDSHGTGHAMKSVYPSLAGKTGTGEIKASQNDTSGTEVGWFTVMTTDSNNPIVVTSMVEDVKNRGGSSYVVKNMKQPLSHYLNK